MHMFTYALEQHENEQRVGQVQIQFYWMMLCYGEGQIHHLISIAQKEEMEKSETEGTWKSSHCLSNKAHSITLPLACLQLKRMLHYAKLQCLFTPSIHKPQIKLWASCCSIQAMTRHVNNRYHTWISQRTLKKDQGASICKYVVPRWSHLCLPNTLIAGLIITIPTNTHIQ